MHRNTNSLSFAFLYPTNFENQKVTLVLQVLNEKEINALNFRGSIDTALLLPQRKRAIRPADVEFLKIKSPETRYILFDADRATFY